MTEEERSMTIGGILGAIVIGLVIGARGRLVAPGRQRIPIWLTIVVGIVAALISTAIVCSLRDANGIGWGHLIVQVARAAIAVSLAPAMRGRRRGVLS